MDITDLLVLGLFLKTIMDGQVMLIEATARILIVFVVFKYQVYNSKGVGIIKKLVAPRGFARGVSMETFKGLKVISIL